MGGQDWGIQYKVAAYVAIGTAAGVASGADFEESFYASAITSLASPAIGGIKGNTLSARLARIAVAATIGGTASEASGGKFANGAQSAAFLYAAVETADYFESEVGGEPSLLPGENRPGQRFYKPDPKTGRMFAKDRSMNTVGFNVPGFACSQGGICSRVLNLIPGLSRAVSRTHDYWLSIPGAPTTALYNFGTMVPAAAVGYGALIGQPIQALSTEQLIYLSVSNSVDRNDDSRSIYGMSLIGRK